MGMNMSEIRWKIVVLVSFILTVFPIFLYVWKFGSLEFSTDIKNWVDFSSYLSPYLVASLTIILAFISWQSLELLKLKEKPIIVIESDLLDPNDPNSSSIFVLKNIGNGVALDLKLFIRITHPIMGSNQFLLRKGLINSHLLPERPTKFEYMVHSINLSKNEILRLDWQISISDLIVTCKDYYDRSYSISVKENKIERFDMDIFKVDSNGEKDGKVWFSRSLSETPNLGPKRIFTLSEVRSKL